MELTHAERFAMETPESIENLCKQAILEEKQFEMEEGWREFIKNDMKKQKEKDTQTYQQIADKYKIGADGFNSDKPFVVNMDKLQHVRGLILMSFKPTTKSSKKHKHHSYNLKHFVEHVLGPYVNHYVSNAELIVAMIEQGFEPSKPSGLNCFFNVDIESDFAKGFKEGKSIWNKRITEKNTYDDMADKDGNFKFDYHTDHGWDPRYDLFVMGYVYAMAQVHEYYYPEPHNKRGNELFLKYDFYKHTCYLSRQYTI